MIFPTGTGAAGFAYMSGSSVLQQGQTLRSSISYSTSGYYQPVVRVISSNPAIYQNIFLGGNPYPIPQYELSITGDIFKSIGELFTTSDGIFGLDPATFSVSFGQSNNEFIQDAQVGVSKIFTGVIHPPNNSSYVYPNELAGFDVSAIRPTNPVYTVTYADPSSGSKYIYQFVVALSVVVVIRFVFRHLFT